MSDIQKLTHIWRSDVYRLLALCLDFPSESILAEVKMLMEDLIEFADHSKEILSELRSLQAAGVSGLEEEHMRLFVTLTECPPSEGSYHMAERGPIISDVTAFYQAFGFRSVETKGPPDAMKMELGFMHFMCLKTANLRGEEGFEVVLKAQRSFLDDHLGRWASIFADKLVETSSNDFFVKVAILLRKWVGLENERFEVKPHKLPNNLLNVIDNSIGCPK